MNVDINEITNHMPDFTSHEDARSWFKEQFHDHFLLRSIDEINGERVFFYHIVKNSESYQQYMETFAKPGNHEITSMAPFESYSTVEISEDGNVSISV